jgi:hypothetical protein
MFIAPLNDLEDNETFRLWKPIRTELLETIFYELCQSINYLINVIENADYKHVQEAYKKIIRTYNILNNVEKEFLNWYTFNKLDGEPIPWKIIQRTNMQGISAISEVYETGKNQQMILTYLKRMMKCLNPIYSLMEHTSVIALSTINEIPRAVEDSSFSLDVTYNYWAKKAIEYAVSEYIAIENIPILKDNRANRELRTCAKCGTEFQRFASHNMHTSKCNGVNRGYVRFVKKEHVEKNSEW